MPSEPHVLFLAPSEFVDSDHPDIKAFVKAKGGGERDPIALALKLFYAVRDGVLYDPYSVRLDRDHYKASSCLKAGRGYCVVKGCLMTAVARAAGIPARLGFADVRNHLATERLKRIMGHDLFTYHGFTELWLDGKWVKCTPAFNLTLCRKFRVLPLDFDGRNDSIFHPFDVDGRKHMEYVHDRGTYVDVPYDDIVADFAVTYPNWFNRDEHTPVGGDFSAEAEAESAKAAS